LYLTAKEAADELGVSVATLYSYVSRKQIRSQRAPQSKARLYWKDDIDSLKRAAKTPANDALVPSTTITLLTPAGPFYRGQSAVKLAETESLESVCGILWGQPAEGAFGRLDFRRSELYDRVWENLADATTAEKVSALLPILERANPRAYDLSPSGYCRTGAEMMRWFASMICGQPTPTDLPLHEVIAQGLKSPPGYSDIVRRMLVLAADHELDPSTYAVRAIANTGVSPYQIALVGFAAAGGRRLTFGRPQALSQMIHEILKNKDPTEPILRRLSEGEPVYGFGSRLYPHGDPRAAALLAVLRETFPDDSELAKLNEAISIAGDVMEAPPDFVIPLSFIGYKLGLIGRESILLRLARMGGWIAHAMEQYHSQEFVRPRTTYLGVLPVEVETEPHALQATP
jgi:citrate synthase